MLGMLSNNCFLSGQVFAQKPALVTLPQKLFHVLRKKQRTKASAHVARSGMCWSKPDALDLLVGELEAPRNGPHLGDQPDEAVIIQPGNRFAQPSARPAQA